MFEFIEILCRRILVIFQAKGIAQIPYHFILQCWTKDANKSIEVIYSEANFAAQSNTSRISRRIHGHHEASMLIDLAEESEEIDKFTISELARTHQSAIAMKANLQTDDELVLSESSLKNVNQICIFEQVNKATQLAIGDLHISQKRERRMEKRYLKMVDLRVGLKYHLINH